MKRLLFGLTTLIVACSTPPQPKICQEADWYEIGRRAGAKGQAVDQNVLERPGLCKTTSSSEKFEMYMNGRNAGLVEYCKPENGFELGRDGKKYSKVCPPGEASEKFRLYYQKGWRVRKLKEENQDLNHKISDLFDKVNQLETSKRRKLDQELLQLRQIRATNNREMSHIEETL